MCLILSYQLAKDGGDCLPYAVLLGTQSSFIAVLIGLNGKIEHPDEHGGEDGQSVSESAWLLDKTLNLSFLLLVLRGAFFDLSIVSLNTCLYISLLLALLESKVEKVEACISVVTMNDMVTLFKAFQAD
jgi:hypothetical protein